MRALTAVGLGAVLLVLYLLLWLVLGAACSDGFYSATRSALCHHRVGLAFVVAFLFVPPVSVVALTVLTRKNVLIFGVFTAWVLIAITAGTIVILIGSGDL